MTTQKKKLDARARLLGTFAIRGGAVDEALDTIFEVDADTADAAGRSLSKLLGAHVEIEYGDPLHRELIARRRVVRGVA